MLPGKTLGGDGVGTAMGTPTLPLPLFSRLLLRLLGWLPPLLPLLLERPEPPPRELLATASSVPQIFWNEYSYNKDNSKAFHFAHDFYSAEGKSGFKARVSITFNKMHYRNWERKLHKRKTCGAPHIKIRTTPSSVPIEPFIWRNFIIKTFAYSDVINLNFYNGILMYYPIMMYSFSSVKFHQKTRNFPHLVHNFLRIN